MARIALVSDVHLGTRQYGLKERYEDFLDAFMEFGNSLRGMNLDAVVIGGDLFDSPRPDAKSVLMAQGVIEDIKVAGLPVYGIDGNHDLSNGGWLDVIGVEPMKEGYYAQVGNVRMSGINYRNGRDLVAEIKRMVDEGVKTDILVMHFALAEMNGGGSADTGVREISPLLDKLGVKAVLMGHVHIPDCRKWNGVLYVNPGSTEMKSSNEPQDKYFCVLDTETWEAAPVPIETRKVVGVEIVDEASLAELRRVLEEEAKNSADLPMVKRPFYQIIADDSVDDGYKRIAAIVHDTGAIARIVMRSSRARDLAPVVDRKESVATLESAIEARFPKESDEAKLISSMLHSPDPSSIHLICQKFMEGESQTTPA